MPFSISNVGVFVIDNYIVVFQIYIWLLLKIGVINGYTPTLVLRTLNTDCNKWNFVNEVLCIMPIHSLSYISNEHTPINKKFILENAQYHAGVMYSFNVFDTKMLDTKSNLNNFLFHFWFPFLQTSGILDAQWSKILV